MDWRPDEPYSQSRCDAEQKISNPAGDGTTVGQSVSSPYSNKAMQDIHVYVCIYARMGVKRMHIGHWWGSQKERTTRKTKT
jgi:hypothetical protein